MYFYFYKRIVTFVHVYACRKRFNRCTYCFGALHILPKQPVELQIPLPLVAGLQALLDSCIDVSNGEHAERRVVRRPVELLLALREDGEEHVVLAADVERGGQHAPRLAEVGRLQQTILDAVLHAADREGHVGVELAIVLAEADDAGSVEEVAGGSAR